ncbi:MAG: DUF4236 domain-containing protein [Chloroflexi bacterium]|nr:DUF4236 domain-containing protein [Chloroflexota bacterium]
MNKLSARWTGGLRFQKQIRLWRIVKLNLSRHGVSLSVGVRGLRVNIGKHGILITLGVPGSGWSYRGGFAWRRNHSMKELEQPQNQEGDE